MINNNCWIQTYSGIKFFPLNPKKEDIDIIDIAHSLSYLCRFNGHSKSFISVAQHSVMVSKICKPENALYGLLHDGSEAFLGDIPSPIKNSGCFDFYKQYEKQLQDLIYLKFGLEPIEPNDVKIADLIALSTEARDFLKTNHPEWKMKYNPLPDKLISLSPEIAKKLFITRFEELYEK